MVDEYTLHFDGSCWPNPGGKAGAGYTLHQGGTLIDSNYKEIGDGPKMSNNVAEYEALCLGLESFIKHKSDNYCYLNVYGDSNMVINQMSKKWKIKSGLYEDYARKVQKKVKEIYSMRTKVHFEWIPRELNQQADDLSKKHLEKVV